MAAILQMTFSQALPWMEMVQIWLICVPEGPIDDKKNWFAVMTSCRPMLAKMHMASAHLKELTHWPLVNTYGDTELGQPWFR